MDAIIKTCHGHVPWNKGKLTGQKPPLKLKDIWAIRIHLQLEKEVRDLAMFNLAIDSKLRGCDLVALKVQDVMHHSHVVTIRGESYRLKEKRRAGVLPRQHPGSDSVSVHQPA